MRPLCNKKICSFIRFSYGLTYTDSSRRSLTFLERVPLTRWVHEEFSSMKLKILAVLGCNQFIFLVSCSAMIVIIKVQIRFLCMPGERTILLSIMCFVKPRS